MKQCYTFITLSCLFLVVFLPSTIAQVFWSEDFSDGIPTDWTIENEMTGPALWFHCNDTSSCPPRVYGPNNADLGFGAFRAPTAANGYAYHDSFSWINPFKSVLRTPGIDISNYENVFLEFYTHIATLNNNPEEFAVFELITPEETIMFKVFPGLWEPESTSANAYRVNFDLTPYLEGVEEIALQWYWDGVQELSWSLDDIVLSSEDPSLPPNTCWSERFAFGMEGWTTTTNVPGAEWEWVEGGDVGPAVFARNGTVIQSPTGADGAMVYNAEFHTSDGELANLYVSPLPQYRSELISPIIDLSCTNKPLELQFSQLIKKGNVYTGQAPVSNQNVPLICSISWRTGEDEEWSTSIDASPFIFPRFSNADPINQERTIIPLPPGLSGATDFQLRFTWAGDLFFWVIDDVAIAERPDYDVKVNRNFYGIMPNAMTPYGQVGEVGFLADLTNIGCQEATGVELDLIISHDETASVIFSDELNFPAVGSDQLAENILFEEQINDAAILHKGAYTGTYLVSQDSLEERLENNRISWPFVVSDSTFAKELGPTRNITSSESFNFSYGNCFFVPNGEGRFARWITVGISNVGQLADSNAEISTFFYKWEDLNDNDLAEPGEYSFAQDSRGVNTYEFNSMQDDDGYITLPVHFEGDGIPLEDSTYYLVVIQYMTSSPVTCNFMASDQFNYQATAFIADSLDQNRYSSVFDLNNSGTFDFIGFGLGIVPVVRLHIGDTADLSVPGIITNDQEAAIPEGKLDLYPNPNQGHFTVDLKLNNLSKYVGVEVLNMSGSILFSKKIENITENQFTLSLPNIAAGTYVLKIQTDQHIFTKEFVVQQ